MSESRNSIIIVDDDKSILRLFSRILQKNGYEVDSAETGEEAVQKIESRHFDAALVDIKLPGIEGTSVLARINQIAPKMVKIVITGFPTEENGAESLDFGAAAYLVKPVDTEELLRIIKEELEKRKQ